MGKRRGLVGVAGAATLAMVLAACGGSSGGGGGGTTTGSSGGETGNAVRGGILNLLGSGDVDYMDPNITYYSTGYENTRLWSRGLFAYGNTDATSTKPMPDLATGDAKSSDNGATWTITMRKGIMWNTPTPREVVASDVVRGLKRSCNPAQPFGGLPDFIDFIKGMKEFCDGYAKVDPKSASAMAAYQNSHDISGVSAPDDHTVVYHLTQPIGFFQSLLVLPPFAPAPKEYDAYVPGSAELAQHTISDGPYYVASYVATKSIDYKRNPQWKADTDPIRHAYVDEIKVDETLQQDAIQQQLETGTPSADAEWDQFPPASAIPGLLARKDPNFHLGPSSSTNPYVIFNLKSTNNNSALQKVKVRQAISYAFDRAHFNQNGGGPKVNPPLTHVLPPEILGSKNFDLYPHDVAKAKQMLADAGYPNGLTLKWLYRPSSSTQSKDFQTAQQDLRQVGINVVGVPVPRADFYTKYLQVPSVAERSVWDVAEAGWGPDWYGNAALSFFGPLFSGPPSYPPVGSNFGFYNNPDVNQLIQQATAATDESKAADLWAQADRKVMEDAPFYPITDPQTPNYHASQVHNAVYIPTFQEFDPANMWLEKGKQGG